jgi:hypothetical protein
LAHRKRWGQLYSAVAALTWRGLRPHMNDT